MAERHRPPRQSLGGVYFSDRIAPAENSARRRAGDPPPKWIGLYGCADAAGGARLVKVSLPSKPTPTATLPADFICPACQARHSGPISLIGRQRRPGEQVDVRARSFGGRRR